MTTTSPAAPSVWSCDSCPALAAVLWLILGILPVLLLTFEQPAAAAGACLAALPAAWLLWHRGGTAARHASFLLPGGVLLAALHAWAPWQSYRRLLPRPACGAEIRAVVTEPLCGGDMLTALPPPPTARAELRALRLDPHGPWLPCRGTVLLRFPESAPLPGYGQTIRAEGGFALPDPALFPGDFNYRHYLATTGVRHLFQAAAWTPETPCAGWRRLPAACLRLRDRALDSLALGLRSPQDLPLLAAITFGYRGGLAPDTRARFIRSGTVHLFSVSGLHVAILASVLLLLLRAVLVPFRARHLLLPPLLGLYVLMTGAAPPAQRAWVMITVWAVARASLLPASSLNSVALAALLLLVANPFALGQTGFQFSFLLVFFLVLGWRPLGRVHAVCRERERWIPARCRPGTALGWLRARLLALATGSALAWLAGAGLVAWSNGRVIPGGILVNMGIGLTSWLLLLTTVLKLLAAALPDLLAGPLHALLGAGIGLLLQATDGLAALGSHWPWSVAVPRPAPGTVLLFYAALTVALAPLATRRWRLAAAGLSAALVLWLVLAPRAAPRGLVVWGDGVAQPGVVLAGGPLPPLAVNVPGGRGGMAVAQWLQTHGWDRLDSIVVTAPAGTGAALRLAASVPAHTLVLPAPPRPPLPVALPRVRLLPAAGAAGDARLVWGAQELRVTRGPEDAVHVRLELARPAAPARLEADRDPLGPVRLRLDVAGEPWLCRTFRPSRAARAAELP